MSFRFIDVSTYQGDIDWKRVKKDYDACFIRVGGRYYTAGTIYKDGKAKQNLDNATKAGMKIGVYFFTQAINEREVIEEANFTLNAIKGYKIDLPVVIDCEINSSKERYAKISPETRTNLAIKFMEIVKKAGYTPMFYCGSYFLKDRMVESKLKNYQMWLAQYTSTPKCSRTFSAWQYSSSGKVEGITGSNGRPLVDMNQGYVEWWKSKEENNTHTDTNNTNNTAKETLIIDGKLGVLSVNKWQKWMKTPQDGVISGQVTTAKKYFPALISVKYGTGGSECVKATQRYLIGKGFNCGTSGIDGRLGKNTITALQKFLNQYSKAGLKVDGILNTETAKAFQKFLNTVA